MDITRMDLAGERFDVDENYHVHLPEGDHIVIVCGTKVGTAGSRFEHPNIAAKQSVVHELKHYHPIRGKYWTHRAGIDFYFVVPKDKIYLIKEKGHSYVPVMINEQKMTFSVSGGGCQDWNDYVQSNVYTYCNCNQKLLKTLAKVAVAPEECEGLVQLRFREMDDNFRYIQKATQYAISTKLDVGHKLVMRSGLAVKGMLTIEHKVRHNGRWIADGWRIKLDHVDWEQTALANNWTPEEPVHDNRIKGYDFVIA